MARGGRIAYVKAMTQPHRPVGPGDHVFLVDGSSFVFRAYYQSIRQDQKYNYRNDRLPIGAVRLFATKLLQFVREGAAGIQADPSRDHLRQDREFFPARHLSCLQGAPKGSSRRASAAVPADARHGFAPSAWFRSSRDRYEADDLIATYARQAREAGADVLIVSADKDLMQLIEPGVAMYDPASGQAGVRLARGAALRRRGSRRVFRASGPTRLSTSRRSPAIRPTTFPALPASASRPRRSSFSNTAILKRCSRALARSSSRSGARR